jgi:hypothetical protein
MQAEQGGWVVDMESRKQALLDRLKARTNRDGRARPGYEQSVVMIRAELQIAEEIVEGVKQNGGS